MDSDGNDFAEIRAITMQAPKPSKMRNVCYDLLNSEPSADTRFETAETLIKFVSKS